MNLLQSPSGSEETLSAISVALEDDNEVVRRTAVRLLAEHGVLATNLLQRALKDEDSLVRRTALLQLLALEPIELSETLTTAMDDPEVMVRWAAVAFLAAQRPATEETIRLLTLAKGDPDESIRSMVTRGLWPFHRNDISLRERTDYDHDVIVLDSLPLPKEDWRFRIDTAEEGHLKGWYEPGLDDHDWDVISVEQTWQQQGHDFIGTAWYRRWFDLPEKMDCSAVDLHFMGVDESAWIWLNGVYVGDHDVGPGGWDQPFLLNVTREIQWGDRNQITVRVMNTAHAGGIWRPILIEVLR